MGKAANPSSVYARIIRQRTRASGLCGIKIVNGLKQATRNLAKRNKLNVRVILSKTLAQQRLTINLALG